MLSLMKQRVGTGIKTMQSKIKLEILRSVLEFSEIMADKEHDKLMEK